MVNIKFTPVHFQELISKGYSMDHIILLKWISEGTDLTYMLQSGIPKISALYQSLIRKGLINDDSITELGKELMIFIDTENPPQLLRKKPAEKKTLTSVPSEDFDLFWKAYPGTDTFTYKGISFTGSRSLRVDRDRCKAKLTSILSEGEHTIIDIVEALNFDVIQKKENSIKNKQNKLTYMQNSFAYLNQLAFEPFIELIKEGVQVQTTSVQQRGGTDI